MMMMQTIIRTRFYLTDEECKCDYGDTKISKQNVFI